jgi:hypothetical protein
VRGERGISLCYVKNVDTFWRLVKFHYNMACKLGRFQGLYPEKGRAQMNQTRPHLSELDGGRHEFCRKSSFSVT